MIKYLDMENASLEINLKTFDEYVKFFKLNYAYLIQINLKRISLLIKEKDMLKIINLINSYNSVGFNKIIFILRLNLTTLPNKKIPNNVVLFNTNKKALFLDRQIFQVFNLCFHNINLISNLINSDINIIVNPIVNIEKISNVMDNLEKLFSKVKNKEINLGGYFVPRSLLKEHPCNAYLCDGFCCHKPISTLPKVISITPDYNVYPHDLISSELIIGNIKNNTLQNILEKYLKSDNHYTFQKYCKKVFIKYLPNYPYEFMPIIEYVKREMNLHE